MSERTHSEHCWRWHLECAGALIDRQQAATARVRERAEGPTPAVHGDWMAGYASAMRDVLHAMDGGV